MNIWETLMNFVFQNPMLAGFIASELMPIVTKNRLTGVVGFVYSILKRIYEPQSVNNYNGITQ